MQVLDGMMIGPLAPPQNSEMPVDLSRIHHRGIKMDIQHFRLSYHSISVGIRRIGGVRRTHERPCCLVHLDLSHYYPLPTYGTVMPLSQGLCNAHQYYKTNPTDDHRSYLPWRVHLLSADGTTIAAML